MPYTLREEDWDLLIKRISSGKCTPFLGAGACYGILPTGYDLAGKWAEKHHYPLQDKNNLARVAQFLATTRNDYAFPKDLIIEEINNCVTPATEPNNIHKLLAEFPLSTYLTTNYDNLMLKALQQVTQADGTKKKPVQELCRWNKSLADLHSVFEDAAGFEPSAETPIVYHLHGSIKEPDSIVITEEDYLDFQINLAMEKDLIPPRIQRALSQTTVLFLGYALADWDFRYIFRTIAGYLEKCVKRVHISVQVEPLEGDVSEQARELARAYLDNYFGESNVTVFWGTCEDFATELRTRWEAGNHDN